MNRTERRRQATRRAILDAARRLIVVHGLGNVTLQMITDEADVATGTFYNHFQDKDELCDELVSADIGESNEAFFAAMEEQEERDPLALLALFGAATLARGYSDRTWARYFDQFAGYGTWPRPVVTELLSQVLERGRETGVFSFVDIEMAVGQLSGSGIGAITILAQERDEAPFDALCRQVLTSGLCQVAADRQRVVDVVDAVMSPSPLQRFSFTPLAERLGLDEAALELSPRR